MKTWIDPTTNLEWEAEENNLELTWKQARNYAKSLGKGWRLPARKELQTLVKTSSPSHGLFLPQLIEEMHMSPDVYWASAIEASNKQAGSVYFASGNAYLRPKNYTFAVRCVRNIGKFKTLVDPDTNLEWEGGENEVRYTWDEAHEYAMNLGDKWRLPTKKELQSLYTAWKIGRMSDDEVLTEYIYWSDSTDPACDRQALTIHFYWGNISSKNKNDSYRIRCVKSIL